MPFFLKKNEYNMLSVLKIHLTISIPNDQHGLIFKYFMVVNFLYPKINSSLLKWVNFTIKCKIYNQKKCNRNIREYKKL